MDLDELLKDDAPFFSDYHVKVLKVFSALEARFKVVAPTFAIIQKLIAVYPPVMPAISSYRTSSIIRELIEWGLLTKTTTKIKQNDGALMKYNVYELINFRWLAKE